MSVSELSRNFVDAAVLADWPSVPIGEITEVGTGGTPSTSRRDYYAGDIPWLKSGDIVGPYITEFPHRISKLGLENSNAKLHPAGSVMIAMSGQGKTRGTSGILTEPSACSQSVAAILPCKDACPEWIHYWLVSQYASIRRITGDNERTGLNLKIIRSLKIPLPPLDEQRRIAARLNEQMAHVARARAAAEERLRLAQQVETACVRSAFHSESAIEWPLVRLGDVCEINPRRPRIDRSDDAPTTFVPMSAVAENGKGIVAAETRPFASVRKGYTYFADGDVIFAKITPCMQNGKHAIVTNTIDGIGFGSTEFHVIRPGSQIAAEWIHYFLLQPEVLNDAEAHLFGAVGQQRVPDSFLHELTIPLPPLDEQRRIVARLNEQVAHSRRIRTIAQSELAKIDVLPAALLREAFGASRLNG